MTSCLLNIDPIRDFLMRQEAEAVERVVDRTNELVLLFRRSGLPVICVRQEFASDLSDAFLEMREQEIRVAIRGTLGAQLDPRLAWHEDDTTLVKKRYSAFFGTDLDELLDRLEVDELILAGVNTHACVRSTAIDAYQRDLKVVLATDCLSSYDQDHAAISMRYMNGKIGRALTNPEIHEHIGFRSYKY